MKKTLPIGEVYRYFRTSKNFALKEAAKDASLLPNFLILKMDGAMFLVLLCSIS